MKASNSSPEEHHINLIRYLEAQFASMNSEALEMIVSGEAGLFARRELEFRKRQICLARKIEEDKGRKIKCTK